MGMKARLGTVSKEEETSVTQNWQQRNITSTAQSTVEDLAVIALPKLEDAEGMSPQVLEEINLQKITEAVNVLVND